MYLGRGTENLLLGEARRHREGVMPLAKTLFEFIDVRLNVGVVDAMKPPVPGFDNTSRRYG